MGIDISSRALAARSLARSAPLLQEFGPLSATDGQPARRAFRDAFAAGEKRLAVGPGVYHLAAIPADEPVRMQTPYQQPSVILPAGFRRLDGRGSELLLYDGRGIRGSAFETWGYPTVMSYLASDVHAGNTTVTLEAGEGAKWAVGDSLIWRLGSLPYDIPEPIEWGMAAVTAVEGDVVTLDRPLPAPFSVASVADLGFVLPSGDTWYNKALHKWPLFDDLTITDLIGSAYRHPEGDCWTEEFIAILGGRRLRFSGCGARRVSIGYSLQYVTGATIEDCWAEDGATFPGSHSKGINLAETRDVQVRNFRGKGLKRLIHLEAGAEASVSGGSFENTGAYDGSGPFGTGCIVFGAVGRSRLSIRDFTVTGYGGYILSNNLNGDPAFSGTIQFEGRLTLIHPEEPWSLQPDQIAGLLDYRIAGNRELWDFRYPRVWKRRIYLRNGLFQNLRGPTGVISRMRVYASPGLTFGSGGQVPSFYIGRSSSNGVNYAASLVAGQEALLTFVGGTVAGPIWTKRNEQLKILLQTEAGTSLDNADAYIDIECDMAFDRLAPASTWQFDSDRRNSGPTGGLREAFFAAFDIPAIAAGGTVAVDLAIPAMSSKALVESIDVAGSLGNVSIRHAETLTGSLRIVFENTTAAALDSAPADLRVLWRESLTSG